MMDKLFGGEVLICGHRGAPSLALENTLESFAAAIEVGVDMIEFDVRLTGCGIPVVFHDASLKRVLGRSGMLLDFSLGELQSFKLSNGEVIPTLEAVLSLIHGRSIPLIEIKEFEAVFPVLDILKRLGIEREVLLESFVLDAVQEMGRKGAGLCAGLLKREVSSKKESSDSIGPTVNKKPTKCEGDGVMGKERDAGDIAYRRSSVTPLIISKPSTVGDILFTAGLIAEAERLGADFLAMEHTLLSPELGRKCASLGIPLATWTVDLERDFQRAVECGVEILITNCPQDALLFKKKRSG